MAKKASKKTKKPAPNKKAAKPKTERKPQARKRRVSLGLPAKNAGTVKAADSPEHPAPPAETKTAAKTDAAGGDSFKNVGDGVYEVTVTRRFTAEETGAVMNSNGETEADVDEIGHGIIDFMHKHIDEAVAEAEADTESEQSRYNAAPAAEKTTAEAPEKK